VRAGTLSPAVVCPVAVSRSLALVALQSGARGCLRAPKSCKRKASQGVGMERGDGNEHRAGVGDAVLIVLPCLRRRDSGSCMQERAAQVGLQVCTEQVVTYCLLIMAKAFCMGRDRKLCCFFS